MGRTMRSAVGALMMGSALVAVVPASAEALVQVSAGGGHSCAIKVDATIACWGSNSDGQATPPAGTFSAVDAGGLHTCAIRTDATVACWGKNDDGESTPPSGTFSSVSAGGDHSCGLRTDSTLACWGRNTQSPPFNVAPLGTYSAVSAGNTAGTTWSCAVATSGVITCWGYNSYGRGNPPPGTFTDAGAGVPTVAGSTTDASHRLLGRLQLQRRAAAETAGRDLHRRQRGLRPLVRDPRGRDARLPWRRLRRASHAAGRDLPLPERRVLPLLRGPVQRRGRVLGLECLGPGEPDPGRAHAAGGRRGAEGTRVPDAAAEHGQRAAGGHGHQQRRGRPRDRGRELQRTGRERLLRRRLDLSRPLPGGQTCSLWVHFAPHSKEEAKAKLVLGTNATPATYEVDLSGIAGSLPQGPQGPAGPGGADGADGANGADGTDGADGADGADGMNGAAGATGQPGPAGPPGRRATPAPA